MKQARDAFKRSGASDWTPERIAQLTVADIKQLRENAERLNEPGVAALCSEALTAATPRARSRTGGKAATRTKARRLIARTRAFEARGVSLQDPRTSWGGMRKSDGAVVLALWADAIESADGGCSYLLWAPNTAGARPWSDGPDDNGSRPTADHDADNQGLIGGHHRPNREISEPTGRSAARVPQVQRKRGRLR